MDRIITYSFYILFFLTPLIFTPFNNELFEYNKMMLTYLLTIIITGAWIIKIIKTKSLYLRKTPLDIFLAFFLASQILATVFSIDKHTSIWGYYSRSNGGLLSVIAYLLLYFALVSNFDTKQAVKFLKVSVFGALAVSAYAIPEHFGISPSCVILTSSFNASCWVQDVQSRVFATLGQPNWLGAYLGMIIFPAIYFFLESKHKFEKIYYYLVTLAIYSAFTFTFSRGATLGLAAGMVVFIIIQKITHQFSLKPSVLLIISFLTINFFFGSALTRFKLITQTQPARSQSLQTTTPGVTQLESGGTESGHIRLIVWAGAIEIFKHYPIFGSGVETFAYSYYQFRPSSHNLVSEWDFLYNKAHNEYLNYLATTGIVGLGSYSIMILVVIIIILRRLKSNPLLLSCLLAGYISYLIQNLFGFSVVVTALFFYLFPGLAFVLVFPARINLKIGGVYQKAIITFIALGAIILVVKLCQIWLADTYLKRGSDYSDLGHSGKAYNMLINAVGLNPNEPLFRSELGLAAASVLVVVPEDSATTSARLKKEAIDETQISLSQSPRNISLWRTAIRTYYQLSILDPEFNQKTLNAVDQAINLAPTDAKLYYNKGLILGQLERYKEGEEALKKAIELKSNYRESYFTLGVFYEQLGQPDSAKESYEAVLKLVPNDPDATKKLEELR